MKFIISMLFVTMLGMSENITKEYITGTVYDPLGNPIENVQIVERGTKNSTKSNSSGFYSIEVEQGASLVFSKVNFKTKQIPVKEQNKIDVTLQVVAVPLEVEEEIVQDIDYENALPANKKSNSMSQGMGRMASPAYIYQENPVMHNTESYSTIHENGFKKVLDNPLSTFSIDVDAASYSNMRRFISNGQLPPKDAIRIEEMINYFDYDYPQPTDEHPFSITTSLSNAPWNNDHQLVQIGIQGKKIETDELPPSNLVFLIDVSGSMNQSNKLPLLKSAFKMLTKELRENDKVAIVVYAGAAGVVLNSTEGNNKKDIHDALDNLQAGGSTAGGQGLRLAYKIAKENYAEGGNNRIIIASDGDFNVGPSSDAEMERLVAEKRDEGIFLTVLGFGMGNYKDSKMETLANKGNGNYAYIDGIMEAKKVLVNEFGGTLFTIAKDVKLQVEFNPNIVQAYRLIGYENRLLNDEDFNDDKKDAGELGSGHTVTALYQVIPVGVDSDFVKDVDPLKYQNKSNNKTSSDELLTVKFRYKKPDGDSSLLINQIQSDEVTQMDENLGWASSVASMGMLLRSSEYIQDWGFDNALEHANNYVGEDKDGYRREFLKLMEIASSLNSQ